MQSIQVYKKEIGESMSNDESLKDHPVFEELAYLKRFYEQLSISVIPWVRSGVYNILNIDSYLYSSTAGTLDSIELVLRNARIADAYALLRRYHDSAIINLYIDELGIEWEESLSLDVPYEGIKEVEGWISGETQMSEFRVMSTKLRQATRLKSINDLLYADSRYKELRERCNSHMHFNYYDNVLVNDKDIHLPQRHSVFERIRLDIIDLALLHLAYVFYAMPHYLTAPDHLDCLEVGALPEEGSEYWVSPYIQTFFDRYFKQYRPDLAKLILDTTSMKLK